MVSVVASIAVECGFEPWLGQTKDYKFGICCFSAKHAAFRRKSKDWLAQNQDKVSRVGRHVNLLTFVSVSLHYKIQTKRVRLVQSGHHLHVIDN